MFCFLFCLFFDSVLLCYLHRCEEASSSPGVSKGIGEGIIEEEEEEEAEEESNKKRMKEDDHEVRPLSPSWFF